MNKETLSAKQLIPTLSDYDYTTLSGIASECGVLFHLGEVDIAALEAFHLINLGLDTKLVSEKIQKNYDILSLQDVFTPKIFIEESPEHVNFLSAYNHLLSEFNSRLLREVTVTKKPKRTNKPLLIRSKPRNAPPVPRLDANPIISQCEIIPLSPRPIIDTPLTAPRGGRDRNLELYKNQRNTK